jgi:tetratricopeptide (TPR) repeat protein
MGKDSRPPDSAAPTADASEIPSGKARRIGHYALQGVIASGGMGTVFKAVQESPRRVVAIKVMRSGVTSASALRRFDYESQLLGRLRHPGIAQVYEAGTHDDGTGPVPFFAMEYIPNAKSITDYAGQKSLGNRERLALFAKVCDAVHHGHQKGIVHRDLKPSNILVGPNGNPRIIDFGVARATDSDMALTMQQTDVGQLVGTLQYMSPEQCLADPHDIDTRSDLYSLGIVLYELVCGQLPYRIDKTPIFEATRVIREQDPTKPSSLNVRLALEKDRDRRYQSAAELAQDLTRYLAGDAISARPASLAYQLRVFARRNKGVLAALGAIFVVVLAGAVVSTAMYFRSEANRLKAEQQQDKAAAAETYLEDLISSLNPTSLGDQVRISELLDRYGRDIEKRFADQPEVEATVRASLANSYIYLNLMQHTDRSGDHWLAAREHLDTALEIRRKVLGVEHPDTLALVEQLAFFLGFGMDLEQAERLRREALDIRERTQGPDDPETLGAAMSLTKLLRKRGKPDEAEALVLRVLEHQKRLLGDDDPATLDTKSSLAWTLQEQGKLEEAVALKREVLESHRRVWDPNSRAIVDAMGDLAHAYLVQGKHEEARALYDATLDHEDLAVDRWIQGESRLSENGLALLVFWEPWCPFSQLYVPGVQEIQSRYEGSIEVLGLTGLTKNSTEEQAVEFIERNRLTFPNATNDRRVISNLGYTGTPNAVVLKDGDIVWKGILADISASEQFFDGLIGRPEGR